MPRPARSPMERNSYDESNTESENCIVGGIDPCARSDHRRVDRAIVTPAFGRSPGPGRGRPQSAIENPALAGGVEQPWSGRPDGTGQPETRLAGLPCSEQHVAGQRTADLKVFSSATVYGRNKPLADIDQLTGLGVAQPQAVADCSPALHRHPSMNWNATCAARIARRAAVSF